MAAVLNTVQSGTALGSTAQAFALYSKLVGSGDTGFTNDNFGTHIDLKKAILLSSNVVTPIFHAEINNQDTELNSRISLTTSSWINCCYLRLARTTMAV